MRSFKSLNPITNIFILFLNIHESNILPLQHFLIRFEILILTILKLKFKAGFQLMYSIL